jgi:hypothetical protein
MLDRVLRRSLLSPSPRWRGEGRGEGRFFEFGQEPLENPIQIFDDVVVPDADHAITEGAKRAVAMPVFRAFRVLAAVVLDNQAPLTTKAPSLTLPRERGRKGWGQRSIGSWRTNLKPPSRRARMRVHNVNSAGVSARRSDRARSAGFSSLRRDAVIPLPKRLPLTLPSPRKRGEGIDTLSALELPLTLR